MLPTFASADIAYMRGGAAFREGDTRMDGYIRAAQTDYRRGTAEYSAFVAGFQEALDVQIEARGHLLATHHCDG